VAATGESQQAAGVDEEADDERAADERAADEQAAAVHEAPAELAPGVDGGTGAGAGDDAEVAPTAVVDEPSEGPVDEGPAPEPAVSGDVGRLFARIRADREAALASARAVLADEEAAAGPAGPGDAA